jgi:hypothetical protein
MAETGILSLLFILFIGGAFALKSAYLFGKEAEREDILRMAQKLPVQPQKSSLIEDRPVEQAAFVFLHDNFIDNPPMEH